MVETDEESLGMIMEHAIKSPFSCMSLNEVGLQILGPKIEKNELA